MTVTAPTRRAALTALAASPVVALAPAVAATGPLEADPAVAAFRAWADAEDAAFATCMAGAHEGAIAATADAESAAMAALVVAEPAGPAGIAAKALGALAAFSEVPARDLGALLAGGPGASDWADGRDVRLLAGAARAALELAGVSLAELQGRS